MPMMASKPKQFMAYPMQMLLRALAVLFSGCVWLCSGDAVLGANKPDCAVVFSWQVGRRNSDPRWGEGGVGGSTGNMFKVAVKSIRDTHPDMPIFLFTNGVVTDDETRGLIKVVQVDLAAEAGLKKMMDLPDADAKLGFGTKLQALLTGWKRNLLPDWVIYLDVDIIISYSDDKYNLYKMVEPLEFYDMAACMEGWGMNLVDAEEHSAVGRGWEINSGSFSIRREASGLLDLWLDIFKKGQVKFKNFMTGEQQALMLALERSKYRVFPLPPIYNFRRFTVSSVYNIPAPPRPVVLRSSVVRDINALVKQGVLDDDIKAKLLNNYAILGVEVAKQEMLSVMEELKERNEQKLHFDCELLTTDSPQQ